MNFERNAHLAFLLSFGALPIACGSSGNGDGSTGNESTGNNNGTSSSGGNDDNNSTPGTTAPADSSGTTENPSTTDNSTTTDNPTSGTDTGTTAADTGTTAADTGSTTEPGTSTSGVSATTGMEGGSTGVGSDGGSTGSMASQACTDYGNHIAECTGNDAAFYIDNCESNLVYAPMISPECGAAYDELVVCITAVDCDALTMGSACPDELMAANTSCGV